MSIYFHISTLVTKCLFTIDSICVKSQDVSPVCKTVVHNFNSTVSSISNRFLTVVGSTNINWGYKVNTGWLYQLIQKHLLICCTKLHYIDFYGPSMSSSHIDIWYLVSNNPEICQKRWKMTFRKKGKIFRVGSNWPII